MTETSVEQSSLLVHRTLKWLRRHNFLPVPIRPQSKAATNNKYASKDYTPPGDEWWVANPRHGVGCITGPQRSGPIDVDLDTPEAMFFAPHFLPHTHAVFGRASKPRSHYVYKVDVPEFDKIAFMDPVHNDTLLELRGDGNHQTVFPGSLHESTGELIDWSDAPDPELVTVDADQLMRAARKVALASLIRRNGLWGKGNHHLLLVRLSGTFFYNDWTLDEALHFFEALSASDQDNDKSTPATVKGTWKKGEAGKKIAGQGKLREHINNDPLTDRILELIGNPTVSLVNEYNERFACVNFGGSFRVAEINNAEIQFYSKENFTDLYGTDYVVLPDGKKASKCKMWLADPRRRLFKKVQFLPGVEQEDLSGVLNLWTGWAVKPKPKADCSAWLELVKDVICGGDARLYEWVIHWYANIVRTPTKRAHTALVLYSKNQGAGKTLMQTYFGRILGSKTGYVSVSDSDSINSKHNGHLAQCLLLHSEEALYAGRNKDASIVKSLITDETRMFEPKFVDGVPVDNYLRLVMTSNEAKAAAVQPGDRRYTVIDLTGRSASDELINRVLTEMDGEGPAALLHYLQTMPYDPKIPRTNIKSAASTNMSTNNFEPHESWWYSILHEGTIFPDYLKGLQIPPTEPWPHTVSSTGLLWLYNDYVKSNHLRQYLNPNAFALRLDEMVGEKLYRGKNGMFEPPTGDDTDAPRELRNLSKRHKGTAGWPDLQACRDAFVKYIGQPIDWPDITDEGLPTFIKKSDEKY